MELLHPFLPFVTEEIYHELRDRNEGDDLCVRQARPVEIEDESAFNNLLKQGDLLKNAITGIRDARNKAQLKPKDSIRLYYQSTENKLYKTISPILSRQVNSSLPEEVVEPVSGSINVVIGRDRFYILSEKPVDTAAQVEELQKELLYLKGFLESINKKVDNDRFVQNAKPEVVNLEKKKKADAESKIRLLEQSLKEISA